MSKLLKPFSLLTLEEMAELTEVEIQEYIKKSIFSEAEIRNTVENCKRIINPKLIK